MKTSISHWLLCLLITGAAAAEPALPSTHEAEAKRLLALLQAALPLHTTRLEQLAPQYALGSNHWVRQFTGVSELTWAGAVAHADAQYGRSQPQRAAFLRRYLHKGAPLACLRDLLLPEDGMHMTTGGGRCSSYLFESAEKPEARIDVWVNSSGVLISEPTFTLLTYTLGGNTFTYLNFDSEDRLTSATLEASATSSASVAAAAPGTLATSATTATPAAPATIRAPKLSVQEIAQSDGTFTYSSDLELSPGRRILTLYSPDLTIRERSLDFDSDRSIRELHEQGRLKRRLHYNTRHVPAGRESYIEKEETFP